MLEIIIVEVIGILLLLYMITRKYKKSNITTILVIIFETISLCYMPYAYYSGYEIKWVSRVFVYIFAIVIPFLIATYEIISGKSYIESIIIYIVGMLVKKGNTKKAKKILLKQIEKNPDSYLLHKELGKIYEKEGGIRKAIAQYLSVIELNRQEYDTMLKIIALLELLEQKDEAIELLGKLITLQKGYPEAYIRYAELLEEKKQKKDATKVYQEGIKYNPDNDVLHYNLALLYAKLNEYLTCKNYLEEVIKIKPNSYITMLNLGQIALIEGDLEKAKRYLDTAIVDEKIEDIVNYEYAKIEILEGNNEAALERLNRALDINPDMINRINQNDIFNDVKQDTVVKVQLVKNERPPLEKKCVEMINILEDALEIAVSLSKNEKMVRRNNKINNIIREKSENRSVGELEQNFLNTQKFLEKHISNADKEFNKHFYGDKGRHSIYNDEVTDKKQENSKGNDKKGEE